MTDLRGRHIVLTGASSGIGEAAARKLAQAGAHLTLVARRGERLERLCAELRAAGGAAEAAPCDLSDPARIDALVAGLAEGPPVDVLINNAAHSIRRPIREAAQRIHDFERLMRLNYLAPVRLTLGLLPAMLARGGGHIINVSSQSVMLPAARYAAYVASKAALEAFSRSIAAELRNDGIRVTVINYPLVRTPMTAPTAIYRRMPMMDVDSAADWMVDAVLHRPARVSDLRGRAFAVATALAPGAMTRFAGWLFDRVAARAARLDSGTR